jgi:hypothetical protein
VNPGDSLHFATALNAPEPIPDVAVATHGIAKQRLPAAKRATPRLPISVPQFPARHEFD